MSRPSRGFAVAWLVAGLWLAGSAAAEGKAPPWNLPPADSCQPEGGLRGAETPEDAPAVTLEAGDTFAVNQLETLRSFLPPALWAYRDRFFYEGMRLEIGACFADCSVPDFFQQATTANAGKATLSKATWPGCPS